MLTEHVATLPKTCQNFRQKENLCYTWYRSNAATDGFYINATKIETMFALKHEEICTTERVIERQGYVTGIKNSIASGSSYALIVEAYSAMDLEL
jgi:hypothetical protein